jgi:hypothetical protein
MADCNEFYLHDGDFDSDITEMEDLWTKESLRRKLAVATGLIGVGTARSMYVPVEVEVRRDPPPAEDLSRWDAVVESGILVPSGDLFVSSSALESDEQIEVAPGCYLARVYYGGLDTVKNDLEGDDHYKVALWPVFRYSVQVLKSWQPKKRRRPSRGQA